jgi:hypothetical protein
MAFRLDASGNIRNHQQDLVLAGKSVARNGSSRLKTEAAAAANVLIGSQPQEDAHVLLLLPLTLLLAALPKAITKLLPGVDEAERRHLRYPIFHAKTSTTTTTTTTTTS